MTDSSIEELEEHQLEDYIKTELKDGFSLEQIKKGLVDAGHPGDFIEKAIEKIDQELKGSPLEKESANIIETKRPIHNKKII